MNITRINTVKVSQLEDSASIEDDDVLYLSLKGSDGAYLSRKVMMSDFIESVKDNIIEEIRRYGMYDSSFLSYTDALEIQNSNTAPKDYTVPFDFAFVSTIGLTYIIDKINDVNVTELNCNDYINNVGKLPNIYRYNFPAGTKLTVKGYQGLATRKFAIIPMYDLNSFAEISEGSGIKRMAFKVSLLTDKEYMESVLADYIDTASFEVKKQDIWYDGGEFVGRYKHRLLSFRIKTKDACGIKIIASTSSFEHAESSGKTVNRKLTFPGTTWITARTAVLHTVFTSTQRHLWEDNDLGAAERNEIKDCTCEFVLFNFNS